MADTGDRLKIAAVILLCLYPAWVLAGDDWLIARVNGLWTWQSTGPAGHVFKKFPNQEVLRLGEKGAVVAVSVQPIPAGKAVTCSESARHNPRDACSSAFLECKAAAGGAFSALLGFVRNGGRGISDARNAYRCSINEDAVLEAAHEVGLIDSILPMDAMQPAESAKAQNGDMPDYFP